MSTAERRLLAAADLGRGSLLWQQNSLDVRQDASLRYRHSAQQLVQLLIVADSQLEVTWDDPRLLVVTSGVTSEL